MFHDPETTSGRRTPAQRCPDEVRRLFLLRYAEEHPRGLRVTERKTPLYLSYRPASPSLYHWVTQPAPNGLRAVGEAALKPLRTLLESCCDALDPYSRFLGKHSAWRGSPLAAALLPAALRANHEGVQKLSAWLDEQLPPQESKADKVRLLKGSVLLHALTGAFQKGDCLARAESLQAALLLEHLRVALEPDPRRGGAPLDGQDTVAIARLDTPPSDPEAAEQEGRLRPLLNLLASVLAERAEGQKGTVVSLLLPHTFPWGEAFAQAIGSGDAARYAVSLAYLFATPERIRVPRQIPVAASLSPEQRERFGSLLVYATAESVGRGSGERNPVSPALVRRLAGGYRALGLSENLLYDRLHHQTTAATPFSLDANRLPASKPLSNAGETHEAPSQAVRLDAAAIERKVVETAQVSRLLHDLFTDDQSSTAAATPAPLPEISLDVSASEKTLLETGLHTLLTELKAQEAWSANDFAARARAQGMLPGAALEAINEAAWEIADEPALEGSDPILVNQEVVDLLLAT